MKTPDDRIKGRIRSALRAADAAMAEPIAARYRPPIDDMPTRALDSIRRQIEASDATATAVGRIAARFEADMRLSEPQLRGFRERTRRAPWFKFGFPVELADGAAYHFPRLTSATPHHMKLLRALDAARAAGDPIGVIEAEMRLFAHLVALNYLPRPGDMDEILRIDYGAGADPKFARMRRALLAVAVGDDPDPKPEPSPEANADAGR